MTMHPRDPRGKTQGVHTGISKSSPLEFATVDPAELTALPEDAARCRRGGRPVPSIVHQIWLGGWKMMYAKLLSVMSVHYLLRPERHVLLYDTVPVDGKGVEWPEWRCACLLARCERTTVPLSIAGRGFDDEARVRQTYAKLRYASDARGRCANSQLDLLRLETLSQHGGSASGVVMPRTARAHLLLSEQVGSCSIWTWSRSDPLDASHRSFINHNQL